jgi:hypothetical protein
MRINYSTSRYLFAHGKRPSGSGYWAFKPTLFCDGREILKVQNDQGLLFFTGTLTAAKKELKATLAVLVPKAKFLEFEVMP